MWAEPFLCQVRKQRSGMENLSTQGHGVRGTTTLARTWSSWYLVQLPFIMWVSLKSVEGLKRIKADLSWARENSSATTASTFAGFSAQWSLDLNCNINSCLSLQPACSLEGFGLAVLHNLMSQFLNINLIVYIHTYSIGFVSLRTLTNTNTNNNSKSLCNCYCYHSHSLYVVTKAQRGYVTCSGSHI